MPRNPCALVLHLALSWLLYLPTDPVPVDAIPDIGENQQIVFTPWMGRSPQDIEDQITYPLTTSLLASALSRVGVTKARLKLSSA